jgi:geranylgeranyl pyrophosphate synthase
LRRGRPSCHRAFDEATAILAGDALQALAFEILAGPEHLADQEAVRRRIMCRLLAHRIGTVGMAGGQAIDLESVGKRIDLAALQDMHRRKTGALIEASVLLGAVAAGVTSGPSYQALQDYSAAIGLAFQIQDDILDVTGTTDSIGKIAGADAALDKPTYTSLLGLDGARRAAAEQHQRALTAVAPLGAAGQELAKLADFVVGRAS